MTFNISVTGHAQTQEKEAEVLGVFREALTKAAEHSELYSVSASTSHHGAVDLRPDQGAADQEANSEG